MRPVRIPDDGYRRGTAIVRRQAACRRAEIRGISILLMRNSFTRVQIFEPISLELRVTCVTDVTRAFDVWVYLYLSCDRADPECVGALVTAEVAVRAHATFPPLQLFAPHTLTHSSCDVKGVRAQKRQIRARAMSD
jgi:hypothetical protein